ncbi:unnamed protein product [Coffea canephora]|uniref:Uncharacterized protein n=1 Tax=Coffea canephora TaxID=49390 RepID=A0A068UK11_COFCA|nr:unnamed protein product [Coffea canephora]
MTENYQVLEEILATFFCCVLKILALALKNADGSR